MTRSAPFVQRRGFALCFRIAVPPDLRPILGRSEITKTLGTSNKAVAFPQALEYAARVKRAFQQLRQTDDMDPKKLDEVMRRAREKLLTDMLEERHEDAVLKLQRAHRAALALARLEAENSALKQFLGSGQGQVPTSTASVVAAPPSTSVPMFGRVVREFLAQYPKDKMAAMFKKHSAVLPLLLEVVGDKPVSDLKQADINAFFSTVSRLPPRWSDECRKRGISVRELAKEDHAKTLGPKSFEDTYRASVRSFLKAAKKDWQDEGFPVNLTTEGIGYRGDRRADENKQRAFTDDELKALFGSAQMRSFAGDRAQEHMFWLPHLGLYTGARVNELCQLNPQVDVLQEPKTGIWYLRIDEATDADDDVVKSVKNKTSVRKVPLHSKLIALGFLDYVRRISQQGHRRLFPAWPPTGEGRASPAAEKWFVRFLTEVGLRDDTPGARVVGMHAFRHTLLHKAYNSNPPLDVTTITGHAGEADAVVAGYQGELSLSNKQKILEAIAFPIER